MATSSIPAAIDHLVATTTGLPECAEPVRVFDGWPDARAETALVIGVTPEDGDTGVQVSYAQLGAQTQWEDYSIPCIIWARRAGADAMRAARLAAFVLFDALDSYLRTPTGRELGGALRSGTAIAGNVSVWQTNTADQAGDGRVCEIRFEIQCRSRSAA